MGTVWSYLDMTALGRQEIWEDSPEGYPQTRPYNGGIGTTATCPVRRPIQSGSRSRTPERPLFGNPAVTPCKGVVEDSLSAWQSHTTPACGRPLLMRGGGGTMRCARRAPQSPSVALVPRAPVAAYSNAYRSCDRACTRVQPR
ncbi:MAG TPA: hypothetical protein VFB54_13145 [Burkholderiales bacterium]|nr:hypothetical protein [Burkholderiales bacterium]